MATISEDSYNVLFISAVIISILFLFSTAYYYDRFSKAETNRLTEKNAAIAKNVAILGLIIAVIMIALLFVLYFGFRKRL
uniref:Uncharacterized protein n=1 Tax=Marseillevirus LCMAC102 TaxID=2506603 RepID=A0A481YU63_9VIRU|nr:MAG: uncharacterized protein LCMAC102_03650 [Marseillevirus LCMAC102]